MSDFTMQELKTLYQWGYEFVCDDPGYEKGSSAHKLLIKVQNMLINSQCDHLETSYSYFISRKSITFESGLPRCKYCGKELKHE